MKRQWRAMLAVVACMFCASGIAAPPAGDIKYVRQRGFHIPYSVDPAESPRLREIQLYHSKDRGRTWEPYTTARPDQARFFFQAAADGEYWFLVRTVTHDRMVTPPRIDGAAPELRVIVDTAPPEVSLRGTNGAGNSVGAEWRINDEELDLPSLRLDFRVANSEVWRDVSIEQKPEGATQWDAGPGGPITIRMRVNDHAGNLTEREITISKPSRATSFAAPGVVGPAFGPGPSANPPPGFSVPPAPAAAPRVNPSTWSQTASNPAPPGIPAVSTNEPTVSSPAVGGLPRGFSPMGPTNGTPQIVAGQANGPTANAAAVDILGAAPLPPTTPMPRIAPANRPTKRMLVNSTRFAINYEVDNLGKSGLGAVRLYWTHDTSTWNLYGEDSDQTSPFEVEVAEEGVYGFTLIGLNGVPLGEDPPASGDPPQAWIEVDIRPPEVKLGRPVVGQGSTAGIVTFTWIAQDQNLARTRSITLQYAEQSSGPWTTIAAKLDNTGRYQWKAPAEAPFRFFARIEATDQAGNISRDVTEQPVVIDLNRPRVKIVGVNATNQSPPPLPE